MESSLKSLLKISLKFKKIIFYFILICSILILSFILVGLLWYKHPFESNPFYFLAIATLVVLIISYYLNAFIYQKKAFKIIENIEAFGNDFVDDLEKIYYSPISCLSRNIKKINIIFNSVNNLSEKEIEEIEKKNLNSPQSNNKESTTLLESDRIYVRHFNDSDLKKVKAYRNDVRCNIYQSYCHFTLEELKKMFSENSKRTLLDENANFALVRKEDNELIGEIYVSNSLPSKEYYIGFTLIPKFQKKGYAFEIVSELLVQMATKLKGYKFVCTIYEKNERSIKLVEKLEFKKDFSFNGEKGKILVYKKTYN